MTYAEKFDQIQKKIDAKSEEMVAVDLKLFSKPITDNNLVKNYHQVKWQLKWLHDEQDKLVADMKKNNLQFSDQLPQ